LRTAPQAPGFELEPLAVENCAEGASGSLQPHQLPTTGARVDETEILHEGHEPALTGRFAGRTNRGRFRIDGGDVEQSSVRIGHHHRSAWVTRQLVFAVGKRLEAKNTVVELGGHDILS
jgi:hypothetical protein